MSLTRALGQFVSELSPNRVPAQAAAVARTGFIDCVGVMIAGREEEPTRILREVLDPGAGDATLYFSERKADGPQAAWINGTAAHALDFDDVALRGHPSTVLVPAILAEAETLDVSGRDMVTAYVAGYETWAELVGREPGFHHGKGWHPTGIFGAIGAAAACASLRRLDPRQTTQAIALGASQSAGLMANFGTMTKPFHAGRSAHSGVMAARLAAAGFTSSEDALEHPQGFLGAVSPAGDVDRESPPAALGETWQIIASGLQHQEIPGLLLHPPRHRRHAGPAEDAAAASRRDRRHHRAAERELRDDPAQSPAADRAGRQVQHRIRDGELGGGQRVGLTELTDAFVQRQDVQALMGKVKVETNTDYDPDQPGASIADQVTVRLRSGNALESDRVARARGHAEKPLSESELFAKFENCLLAGRSSVAASVLFGRLQAMESASARSLTSMH